jgi:hypothetical protein
MTRMVIDGPGSIVWNLIVVRTALGIALSITTPMMQTAICWHSGLAVKRIVTGFVRHIAVIIVMTIRMMQTAIS